MITVHYYINRGHYIDASASCVLMEDNELKECISILEAHTKILKSQQEARLKVIGMLKAARDSAD